LLERIDPNLPPVARYLHHYRHLHFDGHFYFDENFYRYFNVYCFGLI
jgi:hypothetical protein